MPKQINVKLGFEADTSRAKQQIMDLQKSLDNLLSGSIKEGALNGFDTDIAKAQQSILKLKTVLNNSLNMDTGRLDLSKFNTQLNNSGLTLSQLSTQMGSMGTSGQKAFLNLANSIVTAQKPMVETNKLLDGMWTALKNTARWQLSSSLLHGFIGAIQGAYGYAQDLNRSLNDIAIVTGRSTDQMAAFAEQANKSAQALSVSTTAYTDAALIYYQQGLDDAAVKARTDVTMMLSNVTGQSAEEVSSYMTAIWNNFDDGSKSLEYYADVITALGAATASSSKEIASGMQQFAAVAETVGLSYEYAATALATVVAQTRQSESTVGNSFRTIFSRMQGLKLGETLEDGTDLNKYSKALLSIGVSIKDQNGELKEMDTILDEVGEKWQTLSKDQQVALAQTVGGVRQYTNLIALFDNWDKFQKNLSIAQGSEGTLEEQADIYAQSWEAAQKRVRAAWQAIYQDLISDKFFISMLNGFEKILQGVDKFIDSIGGLKGVLSGLGILITSLFKDKLIVGLQNAQQQLKVFSGIAKTEADAVTEAAMISADNMLAERGGGATEYEKAEVDTLKTQLDLNNQLKAVYPDLNNAQKEYANGLIGINKQWEDIYLNALKAKEAAIENAAAAKSVIKDRVIDYRAKNGLSSRDEDSQKFLNQISSLQAIKATAMGNRGIATGTLEEQIKYIQQSGASAEQAEKAYDQLVTTLTKAGSAYGLTAKEARNLVTTIADKIEKTRAAENIFERYTNNVTSTKEAIKELKDMEVTQGMASQDIINLIQGKINALEQEKNKTAETGAEIQRLTQLLRDYKAAQESSLGSSGFAESIVNGARAVSQFSMGINSLSTAWNTFKNPDISGWQKLTSIITSLSFGIPALINGFKGLGGFKTILAGLQNSLNIFTVGWVSNTTAVSGNTLQMQKNTLEQLKNNKAKEIQKLIEMGIGPVHATMLVQREIENKELQINTQETNNNTVAKLASKAAMWEIYLVIGLVVAAIALWNREQEKQRKELEQTDNAIKNARESAEELISAYEELKNKLEELENKKDVLEDLEKGTSDYRAAVADLNAEMLELIRLYNLIEGKDFFYKDGVITLTDQGKDSLNTQALEKQNVGYAQKFAGEATADSGEARARKNLQESFSTSLHLSDQASEDVVSKAYQKFFSEDTLKALQGKDLSNEKALTDLFQQLDFGSLSDDFAKSIASDANLQANIKDLTIAINKNTGVQDAIVKSDIYSRFGEEAENLKDFEANYLQNLIQEQQQKNYANMTEVTALDRDRYARDAGYNNKNDKGQYVNDAGETLEVTDELVRNYISYMDAVDTITKEHIGNIDQWSNEAIKEAKMNFRDQFNQSIKGDEQWSGEVGLDTQKKVWDVWNNATPEQVDILVNFKKEDGESPEDYWNRLKEALESHEIEVKINADDLTQFKGKTKDLVDEVNTLSKFLQNNSEKFKDLSEHIKECKDASDMVAYSLIRFDDAMQDVSKNYKKWKQQLNSDDIVDINEAVNELRKTYGNLFDMDGSKLSDDFLQQGKNLDLLNTILTGTEEEAIRAYDELQKIAFLDLAKTFSPEWNDNIAAQWSALYDNFTSMVEDMHILAGEDIEVGDVRYEQLAQGMNEMLAMLGTDRNAALALMDEMGWKGELTNEPVNVTEPNSQQDIDADVGQKTIEARGVRFDTVDGVDSTSMIANALAPVTGTVPTVHYKTGGETNTTNKKSSMVQAYQLIPNSTLHKKAGGAPKIKNMPARNLSSGKSGGGCFAAGTLITLQNYYKNIEDIQVGDIVLSYNEKTKKNVFNKVFQRMVHIVKEKIYSLFIKDEELTVTGIHRFLITRNNRQEWIQASELQEGDLVLLADGTLQEISDINIEEKPLTVYNFEVSNTHNYYVGENQILAHNKGGGGGKGSSKKAKTEKPKEKKKNIKEEDRYHNIKEKIDDLNKSMDRLNKNKDRAYGKDRIKYMQAEIDKTKEQIGLTKDYIKEIDKYRKIDRANLDKVLGKGWKDLNTGKFVGGLNLKNPDDLFDADGVLKNYEELFNTIQDRFDQTATKTYNKAVDEYNKAVAKFNKDQDQDAFDKAKEKLEAAEEEYKNQEDIYKQQIDYLKQYEETMNLWQEKQQERIDQMNELLDKELELTRHKIELRLEVADDEKSKLEWLYDNLGDSADRAADRIANLGQQARVAHKNIDTYLHALTNELEDIKDWEGYTKAGTKVSLKNLIESGELDYDINDPDSILNAFQKINNYITQDWIGAELPMQEILDDFAKYRDGLMDEYSNLREIADTVEEQLIGAFEEWNEKLDDNLSLFDHYDTVIDTYKEIADLLGSDALGFDPDLDMSYQRAKLSNQQQAARFAKDAYDEAINERIKAQERLANATSDIERKAAEEYLKLCEETERERQEEFLARTRDALRQAQELFEKTLENNQKAYLKSLGGGTPNLGILQNQLDMNKELNDLYLDDYEKYKKLGDLQNNINKQLAKNPNVKVQGKLNDLLDDVNSKMAAGAEISEGEATILEKRLQLLQAEDQLMAARNAKSAVRMTRDNEGNFSYTYTADTSKIEEAQQNYADKFYDLLDYEKQYSQEVQDNILQAMQDFNDKAAEIMEDNTLSQAEKEYLLKQLEDQCKMKVKFYTDQMQIVTDEMTRFKNDDWADMEQTLGRMLASDSDFETNFNETTLGKIAPAWNEAKDAMVDFVNAADTLVDNSIGAMNRLLIDNETTMNLVDSSTEAFAENYTGLLQDVVDKSVAAAEAGESLIQTMSNSLNEVLDETKAYYDEYGKELDDLFERINKVTNVINQFRANWNGEATYDVKTTDTGREGANPSTVSMSNPSEGVNNPTDRFTSTFAGQPVITNVSGTTLPNSTPAELVGDNSEWLNNVIDKAMIKYDSLLSMNKSQTVAGNNNVVINADFPNVESYEEIAKAFETLINSASQYANENNG